MLFQDHLDGQVPAEVDVASLEHRPHPAPSDLAHELIAARVAGEVGHLRRAGPYELTVGRDVAEQDARDRPDRPVQARQHARGHREVRSQTEAEQTLRTKTGRCVRRLLRATVGAEVLGHNQGVRS